MHYLNGAFAGTTENEHKMGKTLHRETLNQVSLYLNKNLLFCRDRLPQKVSEL
jgi:hypothetical protein